MKHCFFLMYSAKTLARVWVSRIRHCLLLLLENVKVAWSLPGMGPPGGCLLANGASKQIPNTL